LKVELKSDENSHLNVTKVQESKTNKSIETSSKSEVNQTESEESSTNQTKSSEDTQASSEESSIKTHQIEASSKNLTKLPSLLVQKSISNNS